jgi:hypothetical protein
MHAQLACDLRGVSALGGAQYDARPKRQRLCGLGAPRPRFHLNPILLPDFDR